LSNSLENMDGRKRELGDQGIAGSQKFNQTRKPKKRILMKEKFLGTWKAAFFESPGPASVRKAVSLALKGICMGSADVIPGVSGGTIALITGIYEDLIAALRSLDIKMVRKILNLDIKGAVADVHIRFLLTLFSGIIVAVLSLAQLMNYLGLSFFFCRDFGSQNSGQ